MPDLTGNFETGRLPKIAPGTVTITIARVPKRGHRDEFEEWCTDMHSAVEQAPGCLGATILRPDRDGNTYQMVFRFADVLSLRQWERSEIRQTLRERGDLLIESERVTATAGTEEFFNALGEVDRHRTKTGRFVADIAWVYPIALISSVALAPHLAKLAILPRVLVSTAVIGASSKYATGPIRKWWRRRRMLPQNSDSR
jgi:antibiotic biosynthesis monooxygenase (ABM) superfamily enzyme